jgi:hypothetical protein
MQNAPSLTAKTVALSRAAHQLMEGGIIFPDPLEPKSKRRNRNLQTNSRACSGNRRALGQTMRDGRPQSMR